MHGQSIRQTEDIADDILWTWLRIGTLKRETESLITAAQDQCIRTNYIKARIDKNQENSLCRMWIKRRNGNACCLSMHETCIERVQKETRLGWKTKSLAIVQEFNHAGKWYECKLESVLESDKSQLL